MSEPMLYVDHPSAEPGSICVLCSVQPKRPLVDHCHKHGWVRGIVCQSCNTRLALIDRSIMPRCETLDFLAALIAHANQCDDCPAISIDDLGPTRSLNSLHRSTRQSTARIAVNLPDDLSAWIAKQAMKNRRSMSNQIVWLLEQQRSESQQEES